MLNISEAEKQRRRRINGSVLGTNAMEGLHADPETAALLKQYEDGTLTREQLSAAIDRHVASLAGSLQEVVGAT